VLTPDGDESLKDIYVSAHFSLIEGGWLVPSSVEKTHEKSGKKLKIPLVGKRGKKWVGKVRIKDRFFKGKPKLNNGKPIGVWLHFIDSMSLFPKSLKELGKLIGIHKLEHDHIEEMALFLKKDRRSFCKYGIRDSVITAEVFAFFSELFASLGIKTRSSMTGYSEEYFKVFFKRLYGATWRSYLGWEKADKKWLLSNASLSFLPYFSGGRSEVHSVGPRSFARYYDLKSAYPTAVIMLNDYDFSDMLMVRGSMALTRCTELYADGPFQVAGVLCTFRFKQGVQPMFPVRTDTGPVYPMTGTTHIMWPEYWTAVKMNLLDDIHISEVCEFKRLDTRKLADETFRLLEKRKDIEMKLIFKNLLNFFYGKTIQGVREVKGRINKFMDVGNAPTSTLTCFPLGAYITSVCRAVIGELLNNNKCYAITVDGFVSPVKELKTGYLSDIIQTKMDEIGFKFIENSFEGDISLFVKTRGYALINEKGFVVEPVILSVVELQKKQMLLNTLRPNSFSIFPRFHGVLLTASSNIHALETFMGDLKTLCKPPKLEFFKLAMMGVQVDRGGGLKRGDNQVVRFVEALEKKKFFKESWAGFKQIRGEIRENDDLSVSVLGEIFSELRFEEGNESQADDAYNPTAIKATINKRKNRLYRKIKEGTPRRVVTEQSINTVFDMKRVPVKPVPVKFEFQGVVFHGVDFETVPLYSVADFGLLRRLVKKNSSALEYWQMRLDVQKIGIDYWRA